MSEENKVDKILVLFTINVPNNTRDSDFNSLVLRLCDLRHLIESSNRNIKEMQKLLDNFIKEINEGE